MTQPKESQGNPATADRPAVEQTLALFNLGCIAAIGWFAFHLITVEPQDAGWLAPREMSACVMDQDGYLRGALYGAIQAELDWSGAGMLCDGMTRPQGQGIRLVFGEQTDPDLPGLVIVLGLADAELGTDVGEIKANVTIIDQTNGKFYSTQEEPRCWTRITKQLLLSGTVEETWRLDGHLYCASALAALAGPGSVTLDDIEYSSIMKPATDSVIP